jgi:hypothetical protein
MRLSVFIFCFLCFTHNCLAYSINPYPRESNLPSQRILNLVFCFLHYQDKQVFLKDTDALIAGLNKIKPFDEFVQDIGFHYVLLSKEEESLIFKKTTGFPPLKVNQVFLNDISAYLKSNYKLIVLDVTGGVSCSELSSLNKMSLVILGKARYKDSNGFTRGFLHELGHSLGLRDEGLSSEAALCLPGPPNCAVTEEEAKNWWGDLAGSVPRVHYIGGCCGNKSYIRPTIASLMNDPDKAEDFGPVNERYLRRALSQTP